MNWRWHSETPEEEGIAPVVEGGREKRGGHECKRGGGGGDGVYRGGLRLKGERKTSPRGAT